MSGVYAILFAIGMASLASGASGYERYITEERVGMAIFSIFQQIVGAAAIAFSLTYGFAA